MASRLAPRASVSLESLIYDEPGCRVTDQVADAQPSRTDGTLVDFVYDELVNLVTGKGFVGPDDLSDARLAQDLGVSRTPVRMALARLESEGLVCRVRGKGWIVSPLTIKDIEDIFDLQELLESFTARQAATKMTPEAAAKLMKTVDDMKQAAAEGDVQEWFAADERFHDILYEVVGNERLRRFMGRLAAQWYRFRMGYVALEGQMAILYEEHRKIAEAIVSGNPDLAAENVVKHDRHIRDNLVNITRNILEPFLGSAILSNRSSHPKSG